jgi:hypothetical protein
LAFDCCAGQDKGSPDLRDVDPFIEHALRRKRLQGAGLIAVKYFCCQLPVAGFLGSELVKMDLSRFCAAPLITYCAAKGMNHEHRQDG